MREMKELRVRSLGREDPLEEEMATHSSILAGKSHGQRSPAGYNPGDHKVSDTTKRLRTHTYTSKEYMWMLPGWYICHTGGIQHMFICASPPQRSPLCRRHTAFVSWVAHSLDGKKTLWLVTSWAWNVSPYRLTFLGDLSLCIRRTDNESLI